MPVAEPKHEFDCAEGTGPGCLRPPHRRRSIHRGVTQGATERSTIPGRDLPVALHGGPVRCAGRARLARSGDAAFDPAARREPHARGLRADRPVSRGVPRCRRREPVRARDRAGRRSQARRSCCLRVLRLAPHRAVGRAAVDRIARPRRGRLRDRRHWSAISAPSGHCASRSFTAASHRSIRKAAARSPRSTRRSAAAASPSPPGISSSAMPTASSSCRKRSKTKRCAGRSPRSPVRTRRATSWLRARSSPTSSPSTACSEKIAGITVARVPRRAIGGSPRRPAAAAPAGSPEGVPWLPGVPPTARIPSAVPSEETQDEVVECCHRDGHPNCWLRPVAAAGGFGDQTFANPAGRLEAAVPGVDEFAPA